MAKKSFELTLESIQLAETGARRVRQTRHAVSAALIWPRNGIARKEYVVGATLEGGAVDLSQAPWHERIVCRESIDGTFGLRIDVTEPLTDSALESFLATFAGLLVSDAAKTIGRADIAAADILSALFSTVAKKSAKTASPANIASGALTLQPSDLREGALLSIPLVAPRAISAKTAASSRSPISGTLDRSTKVVLDKDAPNGTAVLRVHIVS